MGEESEGLDMEEGGDGEAQAVSGSVPASLPPKPNQTKVGTLQFFLLVSFAVVAPGHA